MSTATKKSERDGFFNTQSEVAEDKSFLGFELDFPSLQSIAGISLAIQLWTQPYILKLLDDTSHKYGFQRSNGYKEIKKVVKQLAEMICPDSLKVYISDLIGKIELELHLFFEQDHPKYIYLYNLFKHKGLIFWTIHGTIDEYKSFKTITNQSQEIVGMDLFKLACKYCLEDSISDLWAKMSSRTKISLHQYDDHLTAYWIFSLRNRLSRFLRKIKRSDTNNIYDVNLSIPRNMVSLSIEINNVYSLKYFWCKLNEVEKINNIKKWSLLAVKRSSVDVICFLLPHLNDQDELKEVFQNRRLLCNLSFRWPQKQLLSAHNVMMMCNYLQVNDYSKILKFMLANIKDCKMEVELFRRVWSYSPLICKNYLIKFVIERIEFYITYWNVEVFHTIVVSSSAAEKKDMILRVFGVLKKDNYLEILYLVYTCISKTMPSDQEINTIKICILLNSKFIGKLLHIVGVETTEQLISLCFQDLNEVQSSQKEVIDVAEIFRALVIIGKKEYIDQFLKLIYETEDEICKFKISFFNAPMIKWFPRYNYPGVNWHLKDIIPESCKRWKVYENFIHDNFSSAEEILQFKKKHLNDVIGLVQEEDFELALMFLNWFFSSNDKVETTEANVNQLYSALIILGDFNYLEQFLKWFFKTEDEIKKFKINCLLNQPFSDWNLKNLIPECEERWKLVEKLINYSFCSSEEVAEFREKQVDNVVKGFVHSGDFQLATMLVDWCFDSNEAVHRYKINFFMSYPFQYPSVPECRCVEIAKGFIKWISPNRTEVETFKNHLKIESELTDNAFIYLLDCFIREGCTFGSPYVEFRNNIIVKDMLYKMRNPN